MFGDSVFQDQANPFPSTLFSAYPVPMEYIPNITGRSAMKQGKAREHMLFSPTLIDLV